jgi:GNAT superfamily N-acetyltransferase
VKLDCRKETALMPSIESDPDPLVIRPAVLDDAAALAPIVASLTRAASTAEEMRARMERVAAHPDHHTLVAERGGRVIGLCALMRGMTIHRDGDFVRVVALVVSPEARGGGVGTALMDAAEAWAREIGAHSMHLTTGNHRDDAHRFYRRLGYEETGKRFYRKM